MVPTRQQPAAPPSARRPRWRALLYVAPGLAVIVAFLLVPIAQTLWYSLYSWDGLSAATWVGLGNYAAVLTDPLYLRGFAHVAVLVLFSCVAPISVALLLSAALSRSARLRGAGVFQTLLFLPQVITPVVVGLAWTALYAPSGLVNGVLRAVGLGSLARPWLGDFSVALPAVGLVGTWTQMGLCLVLFLAGIAGIPRELYEAARLDGAGAWQEFWAITLPGLRGELSVALTVTVIAAIRSFDLVYVLTRGGPGTSTTVPAFQIYNLAFNQGQVGAASAVAVVLTALVMAVTALIGRLRPVQDAS